MNSPDPQFALETITQCIFMLRGQKVLLDTDLATLYGVETRRLNEQVRRNWERFPHDFIFELTQDEFSNLKSQNATSSWGGRRKLPLAFTEHGAIMAASILSSPRAVEVSVYVVRAFVQLRELVATHQNLAKRLDVLERRLEEKTELVSMKHDTLSRDTRGQFKQVFDALRALMSPPDLPPKRPIGFVIPQEQKKLKESYKELAEKPLKRIKNK
ncbi:MAG: ORF6N domain-containing protein [Burkholderiaceae bacterium]|nr:ORF6N domain-containing protein [Burkholderiaceae bacterium]